MYFKAQTNGINYEMTVREDRTNWVVSIKPEGGEWSRHNVSKKDYQRFDNTLCFIYNNSSYLVDVIGKGIEYEVYTRGAYRALKLFNDEMLLHESLKSGKGLGGVNDLVAGMPGKIVEVIVKAGDEVKEGDPLIIMEAMKMENEMRAAGDGKVKEVFVKAGQNVEGGSTLLTFV